MPGNRGSVFLPDTLSECLCQGRIKAVLPVESPVPLVWQEYTVRGDQTRSPYLPETPVNRSLDLVDIYEQM